MKKALVFADSKFSVTEWREELLVIRAPTSSTDDVTKSIDTIPQGGNPGAYRQTSLQWKNTAQNGIYSLFIYCSSV